jgi:hypothetical protein
MKLKLKQENIMIAQKNHTSNCCNRFFLHSLQLHKKSPTCTNECTLWTNGWDYSSNI